MTNKKRTANISFAAIVLCFVFLQAQEKEVVIKVVAPPSTPHGAQLFIAGNQTVLGEWDAGKIAMRKESDSIWSFNSRVPTSSILEFKITRGSWSTEALYMMGVIPENTRLTVANDTLIVLRPVGWKDFGIKFEGGITGMVRYHHGLCADSLLNPRDVIVWLPPSYDKDKSKRYPVLYMHDGQNIIDPSTSFAGVDWRVDEIADSLIKEGRIEEIIIVGIYNTKDRVPEYSDTKEGRTYADFVVHTLKPMIDTSYRTEPGREHTAIMGSSMGGLISFLFAWWYPEIFSSAGCLSSAFLVDSNKILRDVKQYAGLKKKLRIYLDVGGAGTEARLKQSYDEMVELLKQKGYVKGKDLEYFYDEGAEHSEKAWARRVWRPLVFMFEK